MEVEFGLIGIPLSVEVIVVVWLSALSLKCEVIIVWLSSYPSSER